MSAIHGVRATAVWAAAGSAAQVGCQVVALVVLARLLTPYEFGVVSAAALVTQLAMIFSEFGVGPYLVQRPQLTPATVGTCYLASCAIGALMAALLWLGAPLLALMLHVAELRLVLRAYAVVFIMMGAAAVHDALLQRELNFRYLAHADAVSFALGYAGVSIGCALAGLSYWSIVIGHLSQAAIRAIMVIARHPDVASSAVSAAELRPLLRFGGGQTLSRLAAFIASQADAFIVTARLGVAPIGYYGRANQLVTMPTAQLGQLFDKVIFPTVARLQHDRARSAAAYCTAVNIMCLLSLPLCVLIWMLAPQIVHVALGPQWDAVVDPVRILALAIPLRLLHKVSDPTARALGATYSRAWRQGVFALSVIALSLVLYRYGLTAVAWGVVAAAALDAVLMVALCASLTGLSAGRLLRAAFPGVGAAALTVLLTGLALLAVQPWRGNDVLVLAAAGLASLATVAVVVHRYRELVR
jgi:PST family polysaccharide transporter